MTIHSRKLVVATVMVAIVASATIFSPCAHAEDTTVTTTTQTTTTNAYVSGPNLTVVHSGLVTLALFYLTSVIVAIESPRTVDNKLYVPVVGPWLDFADRGHCAGCRHETLYKVLLAGDGVFQGLGALQIVSGLLMQERRVSTTTVAQREPVRGPALALTPFRFADGNGYGLAAFGRF